ncbi:MAG: KaiB domain protein [Marmoricola sp.]|nr:KaiB domain protein [Marmoricola sp.]MCW2847074.1 KaiB domain protein [Marmoricola sp.]
MNEATGESYSDLRDDVADVDKVLLRLYIAGQAPRSVRAMENLRRVCRDHLPGRYRVEVIDLLENPSLARRDEIVAVPTLVRTLPSPVRKIIGDLSDTERVLAGLQLASPEVAR